MFKEQKVSVVYFKCDLLLSVCFVLVIACLGMKESSVLNNLLTVLNLGVIAYAVVCGFFWVNGYNWMIPAENVGTHFNAYLIYLFNILS